MKPICHMCTYWRPGISHPQGKQTCDAFTDEIPEEIWNGQVQHTTPVRGDGGIIFAPTEDLTPEDIDEYLNEY